MNYSPREMRDSSLLVSKSPKRCIHTTTLQIDYTTIGTNALK